MAKITLRMPQVPLIILAGRDHGPRSLPPGAQGKHALHGYKAVDVRLGGRPLLQVTRDRLRAVPELGQVYAAGPRSVLGPWAGDISIIDVDGGFGDNIRDSLSAVMAAHPGSPVAILTCDVLPDPAEVNRVMEDWRGRDDLALWFPLILRPEDPSLLGAASWKPSYRFLRDGAPPATVLPGHLAIARPGLLRLRFLYRLLDLGYRTRNQPILTRRRYIMPRLMWELLREDGAALLTARPPTLTATALTAGIQAARRLHDRTLTHRQLELVLERTFTRPRRMGGPMGRVRLPLVDALSLAKDIDTVEEALAIHATVPLANGS